MGHGPWAMGRLKGRTSQIAGGGCVIPSLSRPLSHALYPLARRHSSRRKESSSSGPPPKVGAAPPIPQEGSEGGCHPFKHLPGGAWDGPPGREVARGMPRAAGLAPLPQLLGSFRATHARMQLPMPNTRAPRWCGVTHTHQPGHSSSSATACARCGRSGHRTVGQLWWVAPPK